MDTIWDFVTVCVIPWLMFGFSPLQIRDLITIINGLAIINMIIMIIVHTKFFRIVARMIVRCNVIQIIQLIQ